ncbi:PqqD family protein [Micromonospora sediminicola]|uniref:PqqD family protein n=1 Tax=Micromonospora sediminicola TaxID=946078 RepID=UPI0037B0858F
MTAINDSVILVRGLDVTARLTNSVMEMSDRAEGGVLLETVIGRYVLDRDARLVWLLIDGRHSMGQVLESVAEASGQPLEQIRQPVYDLCERLLEFGLVEIATPADIAALSTR